MDQLLDKTVFGREHNTGADRQYLTGLFKKYMVLGEDGDSDPNGRRVLTKFNAQFCAREILKDWKGLSGQEALDFVEGESFDKIFKEFDYQSNETINQKDAYFWASKLVGETYEGVLSTDPDF